MWGRWGEEWGRCEEVWGRSRRFGGCGKVWEDVRRGEEKCGVRCGVEGKCEEGQGRCGEKCEGGERRRGGDAERGGVRRSVGGLREGRCVGSVAR